MRGCDYCEETLLRSEPVRCVECECVYHDYCAEATGWGSTPEGERLCEGCGDPHAAWFCSGAPSELRPSDA